MIINKKILTGLLATFAIIGAPTLAHAVGPAAATAAQSKSTGEIKFKENTAVIPVINPLDPTGVKVDPSNNNNSTTGPLAINHISNFKFKEEFISGSDQIYYAQLESIKLANSSSTDVPNYIQITDNRGTNVGWKLQVQQGNQFEDGSNELVGASLKLSNPTVKTVQGNVAGAPIASQAVVIVPGSKGVLGPAVDVLKAEANKGMATWIESFGDATTGDKSVSLSVPGTSAKVKGVNYKTELTWTVLDGPV